MTNRTVGIDAIAVYIPDEYLDIRDLAKVNGVDEKKYTVGLGLRQMAVPSSHTDPVTMAVAAASRLLKNYDVSPADIGQLIVGSETPVDASKSTASFVHGLLGLSLDCRTVDVKQACYSATAALKIAADWCLSPFRDAAKIALIIATDIACYEPGSPGEPTQGAGAVAMLVSTSPRILELDAYPSAVYSENTMDFWRPNYRDAAVVNGALSIKTYLKALTTTFQTHSVVSGRGTDAYDYLLFHTPFPEMAKKGFFKLHQAKGQRFIDDNEVQRAFDEKTAPSLYANRAVGNIYTGALYLSLAALLEHRALSLCNKQVGLFSYGSGATAEFFSGRIGPDASVWRGRTGLHDALNGRRQVSHEAYSARRQARARHAENGSYKGGAFRGDATAEPFAFLGIQEHQRHYGPSQLADVLRVRTDIGSVRTGEVRRQAVAHG